MLARLQRRFGRHQHHDDNAGRAAPAPAQAQPQVQPQPQVQARARAEVMARSPVREIQERARSPVRASHLSLADLRIGNEPDGDLANVPAMRESNVDPLNPPTDEQSAGISGRAYLQFLSTDMRLGTAFRMFIAGPRVLGDASLTADKAQRLAEQFRPIASQSYRDPALMRRLETCALETLGYCSDRTQVFVGQMRDAALLSFVSSGAIDDVALYNLGIGFFKLDAVRSAVGRRSPEGGHAQNVHDYLDAEFQLQEKLHLPTRHTRPDYMNTDIVTDRMIREIEAEVLQKITLHDGEKVMDFMSTWGPWREYVCNLPANELAFNRLDETFQKIIEEKEQLREKVDSPYAALTDAEYYGELQIVSACRTDWITQFVGQKTKEFLLNHRMDALMNNGNIPNFFGSFEQR